MITCERTNAVVASRVSVATGLWERSLGFIGRATIAADEAMWFDRCNAVHTVGMRVPIDVVFLDPQMCVIAIEASVMPMRFVVRQAHARSVLELRAGRSAELGLCPGDRLLVQ